MKLIIPKYAEKFKCIGASCTDSCCIGWEIDLDESTLEKYRTVGGEMGKRLSRAISYEGCPHITLSGERCPFLNQEGLCELIINLGEDYLSDICREHPRYYTTLGDITYGGIGLCCEAAAELVLSETGTHGYAEIDSYDAEPCECDGELLELIMPKKQTFIDILRDNHFGLLEKLKRVFEEAIRLQAKIDGKEVALLTPSRGDAEGYLIGLFDSLEYMGEELLPTLREALRGGVCRVELSPVAERYITNVFIYFLDRYVPRAVEDGDLLARVTVASVSALAFALLFLSGEKKDLSAAVNTAKLYSKEIEYNEDNILAIEDSACEGAFGAAAILWERLL